MASGTSELLLPSLLDNLARTDPSRILYSFAKTKDPADGFSDVCATDFARAVDRCSWFIDQTLGPGEGFPTLVYLGPQDLNYPILVTACIKTGYKLLLLSPRNTLEANLSLLETLDCNTFITPINFPLPVVKQTLAARPMQHVEVPNFHHWLENKDGEEWKHYPYTKTFEEANAEPFAVLHTSGSTGLPKPVIQTHGTMAALAAYMKSADHEKTFPSMFSGTRLYSLFPLFHCAGISVALPASLYANYTVVLATFPPSAEIVNGVHVHGNVQHTILPPAILESIVRVPEYLENLGRIKTVTYGGGPVPKAVGDLAITKTRILNCVGSTECGPLPSQLCDDPRDWQYLRLDPKLGYEYRHVSDHLYEQAIVRKDELSDYQGIFATFPELTEWPMKDIYSKHPDPAKGDLWVYRGRTDDIIVFSTGEKINPVEMEDMINGNPAVDTAIIIGQGRFQSSLLVEAIDPPVSADDEQRLLDAVWPSVQAANKECPSHGRIHRNMILFTTAAKPMVRAAKGTVLRKRTLDLYTTELDALYDAADAPVKKPNGVSEGHDESVEAVVKAIVSASTEIEIDGIAPDSDLFELGLDSLQVTVIARKLNEFLASREKPQSAAPKTIYANPTLAALAEAVSAIIEGNASTDGSDEEKLEALYQLHTEHLPISGREALPRPPARSVVLMTGSTGSLGSYVLDALQADDRVARVYCLCRGPDSAARQASLQASRGLRPLSGDKVRCLDADLSASYFGLPIEAYRGLLGAVTHVVHNAWQVDFNLAVQSFSRHVAFVRRLADFSAHSRHGAGLFLVSSIGAVGGLRGDVAERVFADWAAPGRGGYGQSKFLAERVLDAAAREAGVPAIVCRVGQVAGPTSAAGEWPRREWLPSLIASSGRLGKLPGSLGPRLDAVDWVPVDVLGRALVELTLHPLPDTSAPGAVVYHAVNPRTAAWAELVPAVSRRLGSVEVVPLPAWIEALRESESATVTAADMDANPALKLFDFFEGLVDSHATTLRTEDTLEASPTLASVGPVCNEWMDNWMRQWGF
ncbi:hypothetical protein F4802DRAFT_227590 [Xylaria palmicola]|nr:hypothetical protein F4802DRAFT_227590 [Xylaria palmicola]